MPTFAVQPIDQSTNLAFVNSKPTSKASRHLQMLLNDPHHQPLKRSQSTNIFCFERKVEIVKITKPFNTEANISENLCPLHLDNPCRLQVIYDKRIYANCQKILLEQSWFRVSELQQCFKQNQLETTENTNNIIESAFIYKMQKATAQTKKIKLNKEGSKTDNAILLPFSPCFVQRGPTCRVAALGNIVDYLYLTGQSPTWMPPYKKIKCVNFNTGQVPVLNNVEKINFVINYIEKYAKSIYIDETFAGLTIKDIYNIVSREMECVNETKAILQQTGLRLHRERAGYSVKNSIRKIAKLSIQSTQGEVISPEKLTTLAYSLGLYPQTIQCTDIDDFKAHTIENLKNGIPVMAFTSDVPSYPITSKTKKQWQEHAIIIIGYDSPKKLVTYTDYGNIHKAPVEKIWGLMCDSCDERHKEFFYNSKSTAKKSSLASDAASPNNILFGKWHDCEQLLDEYNYYIRVDKTVYFDTDEFEKRSLDKTNLDLLDLTKLTSIRKSQPVERSTNTNFKTKLMTFKSLLAPEYIE